MKTLLKPIRIPLNRFFIALLVLVSLAAGVFAYAQEDKAGPQLSFPIAELGNCGSKEECKVFCDDADNKDACQAWAEKQGLEKKQSQETGPGGCNSRESCDAFCKNPDNAETCIQYAINTGRISSDQAGKMREMLQGGHGKVPAARILREDLGGPRPIGKPAGPKPPEINEEKVKTLLQEKGGPGGCKSFEECHAFCENPENEEACFQYANENDLFPVEERARIEKMRSVEGPGGCRGRQCEAYCEAPGHEEECIAFAEQQGLIPAEEIQKIKKHMEAVKDGGPGGCRGRACEAYCHDPAHREECFAFAKKQGLIPEEEVQRIEKIQNKIQTEGGPGGCKSEEECKTFCSGLDHVDECAAFAVNAGMYSPEQAKQMLQEFMQAEKGLQGPHLEFQRGPGFERFRENLDPAMKEQMPGQFKQEMDERFHKFEEMRKGFEQGMPLGEIRDNFPAPDNFGKPEEIRRQMEQGIFQEEVRRQTEEQMRNQGSFPHQYESFRRPEGEFRPPIDEFKPPEGFQRPPEGVYSQPGTGNYSPSPGDGYTLPPEQHYESAPMPAPAPMDGGSLPPAGASPFWIFQKIFQIFY